MSSSPTNTSPLARAGRVLKRLTGQHRLSRPGRCLLLLDRDEVLDACAFLQQGGFSLHPCEAKNWDLAHILPDVLRGGGDFLDMGAWESYVLRNLAARPFAGELHGIDLQEPSERLPGVTYHVGDLMDTGLPAGKFRHISCVSVIEHGVDFGRFTREASRLLEPGGKLLVTFDYWEPKVVSPIQLFGLPWQPLDRADVERLLTAGAEHGLEPVEPMDWRTDQAVIREGYHSPVPAMSYTFGLIGFEKR